MNRNAYLSLCFPFLLLNFFHFLTLQEWFGSSHHPINRLGDRACFPFRIKVIKFVCRNTSQLDSAVESNVGGLFAVILKNKYKKKEKTPANRRETGSRHKKILTKNSENSFWDLGFITQINYDMQTTSFTEFKRKTCFLYNTLLNAFQVRWSTMF